MSDENLGPQQPAENQPTTEFPQAEHAQEPPVSYAPTAQIPPRRRFRAKRSHVLIGAAAVAGVVLVGGIGYALGDHDSGSSHPAAAGPAAGDHHQGPGRSHRRPTPAVFGTVASENGNTWTITRQDGSSETVTLTDTTRYGTRAHSEDKSQFPVGAQIAVRGKQTGQGEITARWIGSPTDLPPIFRPGAPNAPSAPPAPTQN